MDITIALSKDELEETGMTEDELEVDIIERLDSASPDLPGYNVWIEVERKV
ncbi:MAG: hypothetical protein HRU18_00865 [Pseudoalteromonas sp.]|uniref:hypothetical protein n=1 Tax=Pseudoalteromonas sp. TaxID=53249 RepID=UPI001D47B327|nr:hypothetical protein [Pseudoalteromonas sp.]NRA76731.1 hypothetical protein [Pseudoalteromonas sp.]